MRDSFVFFKSFYDGIKNLPDDVRLEVYDAMCEYSLNGEMPNDLSPVATAMLTLMKANIDSSNKRYEASVNNGKKGGRPKKNNTQEEPSKNLEEPNNNLEKPNENLEEPSVNLNDNDNYNVNDNYNNNKNIVEKIDIISQVIDYLNEKTNANYRKTTPKTRTLINARAKEHFTLDDFKKVIDIKTAEWKGTNMEQYLRPETLFGTKFESYLNTKQNTDNKQSASKDSEPKLDFSRFTV